MAPKKQRHSGPIKGVRELTNILGFDRDVLYSIINAPQDYYSPYDVYKKYDKKTKLHHWRHIDNPQGALKLVQERITKHVLNPVAHILPNHLVGGLPGNSLKDNATPHLGRNVVVEMDLETCFDSVSSKQVRTALIAAGFGRDVATIITKACTFQNRLPQGSPASTILCNFALLDMSNEIRTEADSQSCNFTMYIDDITLSGKKAEVYGLIPRVYKIATAHGMNINSGKTEIFAHNRQQEVTGVLTNMRLAIAKRKIEMIRRKIIASAKELPINRRLIRSLYGQVYWVYFIDPIEGKRLLKLLSETIADKPMYEGPRLTKKLTRQCKGHNSQHKVPA